MLNFNKHLEKVAKMKTENAIKISADELYLKTVAKDTHQKKKQLKAFCSSGRFI